MLGRLWLVFVLLLSVAVWGQSTREATFHEESPDGSRDIRFTFPVDGGPINGEATWIVKTKSRSKDPNSIVPDFTLRFRWLLRGRFEGGDGGRLFVEEVDEKGEVFSKTGVLRADGTGWLGDEEKPRRYPLRFEAFEGGGCGCNLNLNAYEEKVRKKLVDALLKKTSAELYTRFVAGTEGLLSQFLRQVQSLRIDPARYKLGNLLTSRPSRLPTDLLDKLQKGFENSRLGESSAGCKILAKMGSDVVLALRMLEAAEAASAGDYASAKLIVATEAIKAYSPGAGWAVLLGQAVKADWDAFAYRVHQKSFRDWYVKLYYQGGPRPTKKAWRQGKKARLQAFTEDALLYLSSGGEAAQFRAMLVDFAAYRLERKLTRDDFALTEDGSRLRGREAAMVLGALFRHYEEVYQKDLEVEMTRQLATQQARNQKKLTQETEYALEAATEGNFRPAWPHGRECSRFRKIYNEVIREFQKKGLLAP